MEEEVTVTGSIVQGTVETVTAVTEGVVEQSKSMLHLDEVVHFFTRDNLIKCITSLIAILIFFCIYRLVKKLINRSIKPKVQAHTLLLVNKGISYTFYVIIAMYILGLFGINLKAIWGAAGVAGIAIGFAAQTSVSNVISGLFVIGEKSMKIGDYIQVGDVSGTVENISMLSVTVRTLDNQVIRIPNSSIINSNLMNYSYKPMRRFVFDIPVSYETDMEKALECIKKVPAMCPNVVQDPAPAVYYDGFGDAINLKLAVWFKKDDLVTVKNQVYIAVVKACNQDNITIPYTHYDIKIVDDKKPVKSSSVPKTAEKKTGRSVKKS